MEFPVFLRYLPMDLAIRHTRDLYIFLMPPPQFLVTLTNCWEFCTRKNRFPRRPWNPLCKRDNRYRCRYGDTKTPASPEKLRGHGRNAHFIPRYEKSMITPRCRSGMFGIRYSGIVRRFGKTLISCCFCAEYAMDAEASPGFAVENR